MNITLSVNQAKNECSTHGMVYLTTSHSKNVIMLTTLEIDQYEININNIDGFDQEAFDRYYKLIRCCTCGELITGDYATLTVEKENEQDKKGVYTYHPECFKTI